MTELQIIEQYIFEKKGVKIIATPPRNPHEGVLFMHMLAVAKEYFIKKQTES